MRKTIIATFLFSALCQPTASADNDILGADLSYVNEMDDCGAVYRVDGRAMDAYRIFKHHGANMVRLRLWRDPDWTSYSTLADVERSIRRAKRNRMKVMLDFHYSDDWADPSKQVVPRAWAHLTDPKDLADALYDYTHDVLQQLKRKGLMPDIVQVGNEINSELLLDHEVGPVTPPINWERNAILLNAGIKAVRDAGKNSRKKPKVMLHIAQPENVEPWFEDATAAGVTDFDMIGLSYYATWSDYPIPELGEVLRRIRHRYDTEVMVVETAYPWTLDFLDQADNIQGETALTEGYPATIDGQSRYIIDMTQAVIAAGGLGVLYWEPAWVSTGCSTRWGVGSHWENATFFDFNNDNNLHDGIAYMQHDYDHPTKVSFRFDIKGRGPDSLYFASSLFGDEPFGIELKRRKGGYHFETVVMPGETISYQIFADMTFNEGLIRDGELDENGFVIATIGDSKETTLRHRLELP